MVKNTRQWCPCPGANGCVRGGNYHGEKVPFSLLRIVVYSMVLFIQEGTSQYCYNLMLATDMINFMRTRICTSLCLSFMGGETVPLFLITSQLLRSSHDCHFRHYRYVPCHGCVEVYVALLLGAVVSRPQVGGRASSLPPRSLLRAPCSLHCLTALALTDDRDAILLVQSLPVE